MSLNRPLRSGIAKWRHVALSTAVSMEKYTSPRQARFDDIMTVEFVADIIGAGTFVLVMNKYLRGKAEGESFVELLPLFYYEGSRDVRVFGNMYRVSFYGAHMEVDDMILAVLPDLFKETLVRNCTRSVWRSRSPPRSPVRQ